MGRPRISAEEKQATKRAYQKEWRRKQKERAEKLGGRAPRYVDWVVVMRTIEGEKGLITNKFERDEVIRQLALMEWSTKDIASVAGCGFSLVDKIRRRLGVPADNSHSISRSEAERIVAA